ncbi:restriction endonuclease subunit S [Corynebacterium sp. SA-MJD20WY100]|uniref:restriction endonuclease subunit S n=1 Tax=Corynebacterium sp. SA-MJD20WY100 TaxID=3142969 RepID=UPI003221B209
MKRLKTIKLGYLVNFRNGHDVKQTTSGLVPLYGSGGIFGSTDEIMGVGPSVLFGRKGTLDRPNYVEGPFAHVDTAYSTVMLERTHARFLYYWATTVPYWLYSTQTAIPSMTSFTLSQLSVPVYDLDTQRRIAEYLDTETAQIDTMMAKLDELVELLGERREAVLLSSFFTSGDSSAQALWPMSHLGAHSEVVSRGAAPAYVDENGLRVINQKCVRPGGLIDFSLARQHDLAKKSIKRSLYLQEGDVVVNSTGTGTLGRSALVTELSEPTILDGHVTLVRPNGSSLLGAFLAYFLRAQEQWLVREARGSTNQIELGKDTLLTMPVPLPPLDEQRRIAERLDAATARIDTMIDKCNELRDLLKERRAALITAVVTGQREVPHV